MNDLSNSSFCALLPPNLLNTDTRAIGVAVDKQFTELAAYLHKTLIYAALDDLDEPLCDFLAIMFSVNTYDVTAPLQIKRRVIKFAMKAYSRNGTAAVVNETTGAVCGGRAEISEWFEYGGAPHTFRMTIFDGELEITSETYHKIREAAAAHKPVRSYLEGMDLSISAISNAAAIPLFNSFAAQAHLGVFGVSLVLLNGSSLLNGSWILSAQFQRGPHFPVFQLRYAFCAAPVLLFNTRYQQKINVPSQGSFQDFFVSLKKKILVASVFTEFVFQCSAVQQVCNSSKLIQDSMWQLDGAYLMNGNRRLNADIITIEI